MKLNDDPSHPLYKRRPPDDELAEALRAMTYKQVAEKYNVSLHTVKNWVTRAGLARIRSPKARPYRVDTPSNKKFPGVNRLAAMLQRYTQAEIASTLGVARSTVSAWVEQHQLYTRIDRPIRRPETYTPPVYEEDKIPEPIQKWTSMPLVPRKKSA